MNEQLRNIVIQIENQKEQFRSRGLEPTTVYFGKKESKIVHKEAGGLISVDFTSFDDLYFMGLNLQEVDSYSHIGVGFKLEVAE